MLPPMSIKYAIFYIRSSEKYIIFYVKTIAEYHLIDAKKSPVFKQGSVVKKVVS